MIRARARLLGLLVAGALVPGAAAAQERDGTEAEARAFVEAVAGDIDGQVARFHDPLCPIAEGLPAEFNAVVEDRIRAVAEAAGVPVSRDRHCRANLAVLVADDPEAATAALRRRRPDIFGGLAAAEIRRALAAPGPVRSWQSSEARRIEAAAIGESRHSALFQDVHLHHGVPASLLRATSRRELRLSVVLFDLDAIDGLTLMQLADHAALRGLFSSRTEPVGRRTPSILGLFAPAPDIDRMPGASEWDLLYLRALYRSDGTLPAPAQRGAIARLIERQRGRGER